ncbi:MAG TPA: TetR/AcrR family transcriptional regulator [Ktedonobacterales bacterium]
MTRPMAQNETVDAFLDAAERLLISVGYAGISARRLAEEAGANHGLIHYYFGSMEQLFLQVLERFTNRLIARQRAMYAADVPFLEKWRAAMGYLDADFESGYQKIWFELQALAWNHPELRERVASVHDQWRTVLAEAFTTAMGEYGLDAEQFPVEAIVTLVATFNEGIILERLSGITKGHSQLLAMIDWWLVRLEEAKADGRGRNYEGPLS